MTDVQQARIEAAARAMWERSPREGDPTWADLDYGIKEIWRKDAAAALQAADAVVTVEAIIGVLDHEGAQCGNCGREPGDPADCTDCARVLARYAAAIQRLYRGEEQS